MGFLAWILGRSELFLSVKPEKKSSLECSGRGALSHGLRVKLPVRLQHTFPLGCLQRCYAGKHTCLPHELKANDHC